MQKELYYRHSGRFPIVSVPFGFVVGTLAGSVLGAIYAYALLYIPFIYLNAVLAVGFGYGVGWFSSIALTWLNVRNPVVTRVVALVAAIASLYVCWAIWLFALLQKSEYSVSLPELISQPKTVWILIQVVNVEGVWSFGRGSEPVKGMFLWIVWACEALLVSAMAWWATRKAVFTPFCEVCQRWCIPHEAKTKLAAGEVEMLRERIEEKDFNYLEEIGPPPVSATTWHELYLHLCSNCGETNTVTAKLMTFSVNNQGKESIQQKIVIDRALLDSNQAALLIDVCDRLRAKYIAVLEAILEGDSTRDDSVPETTS